MNFHCGPMAKRTNTNLDIPRDKCRTVHSWILRLDQQSQCPPFKMRNLKRTSSLQKEVAKKVIAMFKTRSEREMEMGCRFITLTDEDLIHSKFWKIKINKLKFDIKSLFLRMKIFSHWKKIKTFVVDQKTSA